MEHPTMTLRQRWKNTSLPNKLLVLTGALVAIGTLYQGYVLHESLTQSTVALQNDQRAWIAIESMDVTLLEANRPLKTEVKIINVGKTIAIDLYYPGAVQTSWTQLDIEKFERSTRMPPATAPMRAGALFQNIDVTVPAETNVPLTSQQVDAIKDRRLLVYLFGDIRYKDIFQQPHTTQYCGIFVPATLKFEDCAQHNTVD
jgi:hypothetical protein